MSASTALITIVRHEPSLRCRLHRIRTYLSSDSRSIVVENPAFSVLLNSQNIARPTEPSHDERKNGHTFASFLSKVLAYHTSWPHRRPGQRHPRWQACASSMRTVRARTGLACGRAPHSQPGPSGPGVLPEKEQHRANQARNISASVDCRCSWETSGNRLSFATKDIPGALRPLSRTRSGPHVAPPPTSKAISSHSNRNKIDSISITGSAESSLA